MPIVELGTYATLAAAVVSPTEYASGADRKKLNAAFDIACSQITKHIFKFEAGNRMMLRRKLNKIPLDDIPDEYDDLVAALKEALANSEPLRKKEYSDEDEEIVEFIESALAPLVAALDALK